MDRGLRKWYDVEPFLPPQETIAPPAPQEREATRMGSVRRARRFWPPGSGLRSPSSSSVVHLNEVETRHRNRVLSGAWKSMVGSVSGATKSTQKAVNEVAAHTHTFLSAMKKFIVAGMQAAVGALVKTAKELQTWSKTKANNLVVMVKEKWTTAFTGASSIQYQLAFQKFQKSFESGKAKWDEATQKFAENQAEFVAEMQVSTKGAEVKSRTIKGTIIHQIIPVLKFHHDNDTVHPPIHR